MSQDEKAIRKKIENLTLNALEHEIKPLTTFSTKAVHTCSKQIADLSIDSFSLGYKTGFRDGLLQHKSKNSPFNDIDIISTFAGF